MVWRDKAKAGGGKKNLLLLIRVLVHVIMLLFRFGGSYERDVDEMRVWGFVWDLDRAFARPVRGR